MSKTITVRELIKALLEQKMDDDVHVEIEGGAGISSQKSAITDITHDGYSVRLVPRDYLINKDLL